MKAKLIILVVAVVAGLTGFWYGSYRTYVLAEKQHAWLSQWEFHDRAKTRAGLDLRLLSNLDAGKLSEARDMVEGQMSEALSQHLCPWDTEPPYSPDIRLIRDIREYRSLHPWTNDPPERAERIQNAFKLVN